MRGWVIRQRKDFRGGYFTEDREKALLELPGWRCADNDEPWMDMLRRMRNWLQDKAAEEALDAVITKITEGEQRLLSEWLNEQQKDKRCLTRGECNDADLTAYQIELFRALERTWTLKDNQNSPASHRIEQQGKA